MDKLDPSVHIIRTHLEEKLNGFLNGAAGRIAQYRSNRDAALRRRGTIDERPQFKHELVAAVGDIPAHVAVPVIFDRNASLINDLQLVKNNASSLAAALDSIADWLALNMPQINEENSVGTEVIAGVLEQIQQLSEATRTIVSMPKKYFVERAECEKALLKLPESKALQAQLELVDEEAWDDLERSWRALIRVTLITQSVVTKNAEILSNPVFDKESAGAAVYF